MTNATDRAQADFDYFTHNGELPTHSPMTEDIADAVAYFDGSCQAEDSLWSALRAAYQQANGH